MNRIITILVTIFILLLLYIWISHVWGSDNPRTTKEIVDAPQSELGDGLMADADTSALHTTDITEPPADEEKSADEFDTDRKSTQAVAEEDDTAEPVKPVVEEKKKEEPKPVVTKPVDQPKKSAPVSAPVTTNSKPAATTSKPVATQAKPAATNNTSSNTATATGGKHLVIAGNFSQEHNAKTRVDELKRAGFKEAEVVDFDFSEYRTVCVGRFSDVNEARRLVKKLKDYHKIDAYVRIGS